MSLPHEWGPWYEKLSIYGDATGSAERRCQNCNWPERGDIPTLCQWLAMSRRARRRR